MHESNSQRSNFLSAFCILTFLGSGLSFLMYFFAALFFEGASEFIIKYSRWSSTEDISPLYFTLLMAFNAISLTGAIRMWKLHRDGFFLYVISQLIIVFVPAIWINIDAISISNIIFTLVFFIEYGINFRNFS
ncbi:MAG: hypothetical protein JXR61_03955 [Prolixibacteraceae bacterium]|nr:hypothetical protein [Prolixibacteraceae bacterium]